MELSESTENKERRYEKGNATKISCNDGNFMSIYEALLTKKSPAPSNPPASEVFLFQDGIEEKHQHL